MKQEQEKPNAIQSNYRNSPAHFSGSLIQSALSFLSEIGATKGIIALVDQGICSATNFVTSIVVARVCSKEEFGFYMLGFSIVLFIIGTGNSLGTAPYMVYGQRINGKERREYETSTLVQQFALSIFVTVFLITGAITLSSFTGQAQMAAIIWSLAITIFAIQLKEYARQISFADLEVKKALLLDISVAVMQIGAISIFVLLGGLSAARTYLLTGIACALAGSTWIFSRRSRLLYSRKHLILHLKQNWLFGRWLFLTNIAVIGSVQLYPWILKTFHGAEATARFAACLNILYVANPFLLGISNFFGPKTARVYATHNKEELRGFVIKVTLLIALFMCIFSAVMLLFGSSILVLVYGQKYSGNGFILSILVFSQLALVLTIPVNYGLLAMERSDVGFKSYLLALATMLLLGLWLTKYHGPSGAAISLLAGNSVASIFRVIQFRRCVNANNLRLKTV